MLKSVHTPVAASLLVMCAAALCACGEASTQGEPTDTATDVVTALSDTTTAADMASADTAGEVLSAVGELVIPVGLVEAGPLYLGLAQGVSEGEGGRKVLAVEAALMLAVGDPYPPRLRATVGNAYEQTCGLLMGRFEVREVESVSDTAKIAAQAIEGDVSVEVTGEVVGLVKVRGVYVPDPAGGDAPCLEAWQAPQGVDFVLNLNVTAQQPAGAQWGLPFACAQEPSRYALGGAQALGLSLTLLNSAGAAMRAMNADPQRPMTVTARGPEGAALTLDPASGGVEALRFPQAVGAVTLRPTLGEALTFTLAGVEEIQAADAVDVHFALAGYGGNTITLEEGGAYDAFHRSSSRIVTTVSGLRVRGEQVCTALEPSWFVLTSSTPQACTPDVAPLDYPEHPFGVLTGQAAHVIADGVCAVQLQMPRFNGGEGVAAGVSVTFTRTDTMLDPW
jgi:hypothetical protein